MPSSEELGEEFVLRHIYDPQGYDPARAHEYYLRTRHLKGRRVSAARPTHSRTSKGVLQGNKHVGPKKTPAQHKREIEAKTIALKGRLEMLKKVLAQLVAEAKKRSGVKTPEKKAKPKTSTTTKKAPEQKLTTQEKAKKAKEAKIAYEKNKSPEQQLQEVAAQVKAMEEKIAVTRAEIAAMRKQQTAAPSGAGSNQNRKEKARA